MSGTVILIVMAVLNTAMAQKVVFEKSAVFHSKFKALDSNKTTMGYLHVPETWGSNNGKMIRVAVTIIKNTSGIANADAVLFIQGGPGASGVETVWSWLNHPLRKKNDIVLFDFRGTGYSLPRLCPDLGKSFMAILAKNQTAAQDELDKTNAALACKQELINKGVNINEYNSRSAAQDIHALKTVLNYRKWTVYGVSYGTFIAQVYASSFPDDVNSLILDSSVDDITTYYERNTANYMLALDKVFAACSANKACSRQFPNIKETYFSVIADLQKEPLTVSVDKSILPSGSFTYNAEDFKVAIQQALYNKQLVAVIPLLITQFKERNKPALGNLVTSFSALLGMDYGVYYCVSCNEAIPNNNFLKYDQDAARYTGLQGGISFYRSDFSVCNAWNNKQGDTARLPYTAPNLAAIQFPVLVMGGEFDPITPQENAKKLAAKFSKAYSVDAYSYGHVPGFTRVGQELVAKFVNEPGTVPDVNAFKKVEPVQLVSGIAVNKGISKMGRSFQPPDYLLLFPLALALLIVTVFVFLYLVKLIGNQYNRMADKLVRVGIIATSVVGVVIILSLLLAILKVSKQNVFILAFGLPQQYGYLFPLAFVFLALLALTAVYYFITRNKTTDRSIVFLALFSNILLAAYLFYWGIV
ncbi:MAG: alpha/beta fold hydrolase [Dinghuibacter sp.]|nr:alpha/beta fold hydrolase [Dinghuibacter sp.]